MDGEKTIRFRADCNIADKLKALAQKSGRSKSAVIRGLIEGAVLREMPHADYWKLTNELHAIGVNLNQIAFVANATSVIDKGDYIATAAEVNSQIAEIKLAVMER